MAGAAGRFCHKPAGVVSVVSHCRNKIGLQTRQPNHARDGQPRIGIRKIASPIMLHRNGSCDDMAQQNRLFGKKVLEGIGSAYVTNWNNSSSNQFQF